MEDEEAKRILEERDKQLTKEYKERQNPKKPDEKQLLGSQILDNIQGKIGEAGSAIMEAAQEDPDTWTDDLIRIGLGGVKNVGTVLGAPGIKQGLQLVGAPAYYVGRGLGYGLEKAGVDPRYGHILGEVGEWFIPGYGMYRAAGKIVKGAKGLRGLSTIDNLSPSVAAARRGSLSPSSGDIENIESVLNPERLAKIKTLKTNLLRNLSLEDSYTKGFKLGKGVGDDIPDPWSPTLALDGKKEFFAKGETKRKLSAKYTTGQEVTPKIKEEWVQSGKDTLANYENALGIKFGPKTPGGPIENHHAGIIRQIFEATNGLTQEFRTKSSNYMSHRLGIELGFSKKNAFPIPIRFHPRIHALINKRISRGSGYNLKGIEEKFNLSPNWQTELSYRQRLPIYNELISTIGDSIKQIDVFWKGLQSRVDLGKGKLLNKEEFMDITLDVLDLDKRLTDAPSPPLMQRKDLGWKATDTASEIMNEILENAGKADLTLPIFKPLDKTLTKEALGIIIQKNGWKALHEVVISGQTPATVFKTYGIKPSNKLIKAIQKDNAAYQHMLRSRHQSIPPADSPWDLGRDN